MSRKFINFTFQLPDRETDLCPDCNTSDFFDQNDRDELCQNDFHLAEMSVQIPAKWEICDVCDGNGTHVNRNIDGNGITTDEWNGPDWDDESREMYMSGGYDVACEANCSNGKQ